MTTESERKYPEFTAPQSEREMTEEERVEAAALRSRLRQLVGQERKTHLTRAQCGLLLFRLEESRLLVGALLAGLCKVLGDSVDTGPLGQTAWGLFNDQLRATALAIGDTDPALDAPDESCSWLSWFVWENDFGGKHMAAGYGKRVRPIVTVDDLLDLIEESWVSGAGE